MMWAKGRDRAQAPLLQARAVLASGSNTQPVGLMLHVHLGQVLLLVPRALAGSKCPHCGHDSTGCSRIMAANATLPAAVRAGTDIPAAVTQLPAWAWPYHVLSTPTIPGVHPADLVGFCLTQLPVGLMFSCDLCSFPALAPAPREGCCVVSEHGVPQPSCPAWL